MGFGEVAVLAHVCTQFGLLDAIEQRVRFARARFGHYDTIYGVVKVLEDRSGHSSPDMLWEPKSAFAALADTYHD